MTILNLFRTCAALSAMAVPLAQRYFSYTGAITQDDNDGTGMVAADPTTGNAFDLYCRSACRRGATSDSPLGVPEPGSGSVPMLALAIVACHA